MVVSFGRNYATTIESTIESTGLNTLAVTVTDNARRATIKHRTFSSAKLVPRHGKG
jgi:hypothetical protein